jgi:hypothetical protein
VTAPATSITLSADLPTLPEEIERWIARVEAAGDVASVSLHRLTGKRYTRHAAWRREHDGELHAWVVSQCTQYCLQHGEATFAVEMPGIERDERLVWLACVSEHEAPIVLPRHAGAQDLVNASWGLTFRAAEMMLKAASAAPRLVSEVAEVYTEALKLVREQGQQNDRVQIAEVEAAASSDKLDKVLQLLGMAGIGGGGSPGGGNGVAAVTGPAQASAVSQELLRGLQPEEVRSVLSSPAGAALAVVNDWGALQECLEALWSDLSAGRVVVSPPSVEKLRAIVRRHQP